VQTDARSFHSTLIQQKEKFVCLFVCFWFSSIERFDANALTSVLLQHNLQFQIDASHNLTTHSPTANTVQVAALGAVSITCRLFSKFVRVGSMSGGSQGPPLSRRLIVYFMGGEHIVNDEKSLERGRHLQFWADQTQAPVLCVSYSTAPENPFPHAMNE
jgi:acetyl esterase/lipase